MKKIDMLLGLSQHIEGKQGERVTLTATCLAPFSVKAIHLSDSIQRIADLVSLSVDGLELWHSALEGDEAGDVLASERGLRLGPDARSQVHDAPAEVVAVLELAEAYAGRADACCRVEVDREQLERVMRSGS